MNFVYFLLKSISHLHLEVFEARKHHIIHATKAVAPGQKGTEVETDEVAGDVDVDGDEAVPIDNKRSDDEEDDAEE